MSYSYCITEECKHTKMSNVKELSQEEVRARFENLFREIVANEIQCDKWEQADVVFRNGKASESFDDVEFLMASHQNGASLLYSSQSQGNGVYSVISKDSRVSFSCRPKS